MWAGEGEHALQLWFGLSLLALAGLYAAGLSRVWRRVGFGRGVSVARAAAFLTGVIVLAAALLGLNGPADRALSWLMAQHLLLLMVAAPLLVAGWTLTVLTRLLPRTWRRGLRGATVWRAARSALNRPAFVWVLTTALLGAWHVPAFYDAAARDEHLRALELLSFLGMGALFWWAVLRPPGRSARARGATAVVYLFAAALQSSLMGALLTFARAPLYPEYARRALTQGHDPLADQQLAGLLMWMPMDVVFVTAASLFFVHWLRDEERAQRAREELSTHGGASP